jgi:hypothetical protein
MDLHKEQATWESLYYTHTSLTTGMHAFHKENDKSIAKIALTNVYILSVQDTNSRVWSASLPGLEHGSLCTLT